MSFRHKILSLAVMTLAAQALQAQGLRVPAAPAPAPATVSPTRSSTATTQADYIMAVVNSEPITSGDVREEMSRIALQLSQQGRPAPEAKAFASEVLESLINRKAQLQHAQELGVRVEESVINQAEQNIALQNQFDVAELHRRVVRDGVSVKQFRATLADQITLQRLREREVESRVRVSDQEVEQYQSEQQSMVDVSKLQLNLAQILVAVPESATDVQVQALRVRAQRALDRAKAGEDFASLVREFSEASDVSNGGQLGLRPASRYPELFVQAAQALAVGDVAALVRSAAGFHVLKVIEKVVPGAPTAAVTQSRARHILLVPGPSQNESEARMILLDFKKRVLSKQTDFATLAKEHSQDGSAVKGGDLGWSTPGMFVPEFEDALNRLAPGDISDPVLSRYGVHLIQLDARRKAELTPAQQREAVRAMLREKKIAEAYPPWAQDVRARAYVEMREPPQ